MSGPLSAVRGACMRLADAVVTMRFTRWTWQGLGEQKFSGDLPEFRPTDRDAVREMMSGRYLLASKLIETGGTSPFAVDTDHPDWWNNLQGFSWLRHFRDSRDPGEKLFARTLVLDWIGREGKFDPDSWSLSLTAQRILNWLRHLPLLLDGATPEQAKTIQRSIGTQAQSLKLRGNLATDPVETLFAAIGLLAAELCEPAESRSVEPRLIRLNDLLSQQIDDEGLHKSRNPRVQLSLLVELSTLRRAAGRHGSAALSELSDRIDRMHEALDAVTLSSGEPVYFNGCGQVPHDVLVSVQANGPNITSRRSRILGGYGILRSGPAVVIADSGLRPPSGFDGEAHAGALAFEFASGSELILGSCGPAPSDMPETRDLFRQSIAHSSPTIDDEDSAPVRKRFGGSVVTPDMELDTVEHMLALSTTGYASRFGAEIERRLTLMGEGTTLVGQDRIVATGETKGHLAIRFHLAPGVLVHAPVSEGMRRLTLPNGEVWSFLWEGAHLREDDSVRQSSYLGFHRTIQLVLEAEVTDGREVAWILTREQ